MGLFDFFKRKMDAEEVAQELWILCLESAKPMYDILSPLISEFELDDNDKNVLWYELMFVSLWSISRAIQPLESGKKILDKLHELFFISYKKITDVENLAPLLLHMDNRYLEYHSFWDKQDIISLTHTILLNMFNDGKYDLRLSNVEYWMIMSKHIEILYTESIKFTSKIRVVCN